MYGKSPGLTVVVGLLLVSLILILTIIQLQAVIPLVAGDTLAQLDDTQLQDVARASLTGVAATAWAMTLLLSTVGVQSTGIANVAGSRGIGRPARALGLFLPLTAVASVVAVVLVGPTCCAALYQILVGSGSTAVAAGTISVLLTPTIAVTASATALVVQRVSSTAIHRLSNTDVAESVGASLSGAALIAGVALVLSGKTVGLFVLAPPAILVGGAPQSWPAAFVLILAAVAWVVLVLTVLYSGVTGRRAGAGAGWDLRALHLPNPIATSELRQMLRDPMTLSSSAVAGAAAIVIAVMVRGGDLDPSAARFLLLCVVGITSLAPSLSGFRGAGMGWIYLTHPRAYERWFVNAALAALVGTTLITSMCRALTTLPFAPSSDLFLVCLSVCGSMIGLTCGVVTARPGTSAENKTALYGGAILALAVLGLAIWPALGTDLLADSDVASCLYLILVALLAELAGYLVVRQRTRQTGGIRVVS